MTFFLERIAGEVVQFHGLEPHSILKQYSITVTDGPAAIFWQVGVNVALLVEGFVGAAGGHGGEGARCDENGCEKLVHCVSQDMLRTP